MFFKRLRSKNQDRKKRNYIIIGLCTVLMIMSIGFAAFSQQLQINSTSEVTSSWDVHIKDDGVTYKNAVEATSTYYINSDGYLKYEYTFRTYGVRPVMYLSSTIHLKGSGTSTAPYYIDED